MCYLPLFLFVFIRNSGWDISAIAGKAEVKWLVGPCLIINMELKRDKATGTGSSYMQNICYYIENWTDVAAKPVRIGSNCPSILVEITGPEISFWFSPCASLI